MMYFYCQRCSPVVFSQWSPLLKRNQSKKLSTPIALLLCRVCVRVGKCVYVCACVCECVRVCACVCV